MTLRFSEPFAARLRQLGVNEYGIARHYRFTKLYVIRAHEIADAATRLCELEQQQARDLRHRFHLHHSRHHRMTRKMSLEKRLVDRHRFHADALRSAFVETYNSVDHQKRIPMRQNLHDLVGVEPAVAFGNDSRNRQRFTSRSFFGDCARQFRIRRVSRFYRDEMTTDPATEEREVADDVENFVPDKLVRKTQRLFTQDGVAAHDHGVFQTAALDEVFLHQRLDVFVVNEGSRRRDFTFKNLRRNIGGQKLRESVIRSRLGAGNAEAVVIREKNQHCAGFCFDVHRLAHVKKLSWRFLRRDAGAFDNIYIRFRAAIADWRLVRVHLHDRVVDTHPRKRSQHVFDGVDTHLTFADRGRALDHLQVVDLRVDRRFVVQILPFEFDSVIRRRWLQLQRNLFAGVQRHSAETGGFRERVLRFRRKNHGA